VSAKRKSFTVEASGVRVRCFLDGAHYWLDVRTGNGRKRVSARTTDRATAKQSAEDLAREMAKQELLGVTPDTITMGQLFAAYHKHKGDGLKHQWKRGAETRSKMFLAAWGDAFPVAQVSQTSVDAYSAARRAGRVAPALRAKQIQKSADALAALRRMQQDADPADPKVRQLTADAVAPRPLRDGALESDFSWLSSVFNWACEHKLPSGQRLLNHNPLHDCRKSLPHEKNIRRPIASHDRYVRTLEAADTIDPAGRLRLILALARYTGRRESAIIQLRASDMLLSTPRLARALADEGMDERLAEHMPHGAIRWSAASDKQGMLHVTPIAEHSRREIELYLATNPRVGDVPLFPGPKDATRPISRVIAYRWLIAAEEAAGVSKLLGGGFHPYRRLWASERKHLSDVDVAVAGGWKSTKTLAIYQQSDPAAVLAAVMNGG
jgi:hypothetical protein